LSDCGTFVGVNWETGMQFHVILFVGDIRFSSFGGDTETNTSTFLLLFKKKDYFEPIDEGAPHQTY
jgi:hypothetical protein